MSRYINRKCPKCRDHFGVLVNQLPGRKGERRIDGYCAVCGYQLTGWRLLLGRKQTPEIRYARIPKVFR